MFLLRNSSEEGSFALSITKVKVINIASVNARVNVDGQINGWKVEHLYCRPDKKGVALTTGDRL